MSTTPHFPAEEGTTTRYVCHACKHRFPVATAIPLFAVGCCAAPDIHVHDTATPCELCVDACSALRCPETLGIALTPVEAHFSAFSGGSHPVTPSPAKWHLPLCPLHQAMLERGESFVGLLPPMVSLFKSQIWEM